MNHNDGSSGVSRCTVAVHKDAKEAVPVPTECEATGKSLT